MKKIVALFSILCLLYSCDDGDLKLESFNFDSAIIQKCSNKTFLYKTKSNELLLLDIPESSYENTITTPGNPRIVEISGSNSIIYRKYNGTTSSATVCSSIPPSSPIVSEEWSATGGQVQIITTAVTDTSGIVTSYNHNIVFTNVNFASPNNSFSFQSYTFGNYTTQP